MEGVTGKPCNQPHAHNLGICSPLSTLCRSPSASNGSDHDRPVRGLRQRAHGGSPHGLGRLRPGHLRARVSKMAAVVSVYRM